MLVGGLVNNWYGTDAYVQLIDTRDPEALSMVQARYKGTSLSVRIEGPAWEKYQQQIVKCGFDNVSQHNFAHAYAATIPEPSPTG